MTKCKKVLVMAGGTGGHVFPALAIANELKKSGVEILWLGTRGRMEEMLVPKYGFEIKYIKVSGVRRNGIKTLLKAPFKIVKAIMDARKIIKEFNPDVVLGMGGYASGPGGVAAKLLGIPLVLHEQNAAAGLTNKLLSKIASKVMLGFPGAFTGDKVEVVGNPVRESIIALHNQKRDFNHSPLNIAIVGGSLGARALNDVVPQALMNFKNNEIKVTHQCGKGNHEKVEVLYHGANFEYKATDFIDDMDNLYKNADLIICRAGALTVAETCTAGLPAIFVPLPTAVDDHQTKNAQSLVNEGAAILCAQTDMKADDLYKLVADLVNNKQKLENMSLHAFECAHVDATEKAVKIIESLVKE